MVGLVVKDDGWRIPDKPPNSHTPSPRNRGHTAWTKKRGPVTPSPTSTTLQRSPKAMVPSLKRPRRPMTAHRRGRPVARAASVDVHAGRARRRGIHASRAHARACPREGPVGRVIALAVWALGPPGCIRVPAAQALSGVSDAGRGR